MVCTLHIQALTLENYDEIQFKLQRDTNSGALIFILAWVVFGYYVLLVLFMAIILEAFESKYYKGALQEAYLACKLNHAPATLRIPAARSICCLLYACQCTFL